MGEAARSLNNCRRNMAANDSEILRDSNNLVKINNVPLNFAIRNYDRFSWYCGYLRNVIEVTLRGHVCNMAALGYHTSGVLWRYFIENAMRHIIRYQLRCNIFANKTGNSETSPQTRGDVG